MKRWRQITALVLAVVLAVNGLPVFPAVQTLAAEGSPLEEAPQTRDIEAAEYDARDTLPQNQMRFVQTGFDSSTGILTMSLQIRPESDSGNETVSEGVFAFQTNAATVVPVTHPTDTNNNLIAEGREPIRATGQVAAVVATTDATLTTAMRDYLAAKNRSLRVPQEPVNGMTSFSRTMGSAPGLFQTNQVGYMVSTARRDAGESPMLDCYFQFYIDWWTELPRSADGYINIMDFDFQCYAGTDEEGNPKPATGPDCLFSGSIKVPQSQEEAQAILDQFYYLDSEYNKIPMTMGGAGFIQKYWTGSAWMEGNAFHYFDEPVLSKWRKGISQRASWSVKTVAQQVQGETAPGLWYQNCTEEYIVQGLISSCHNTFRGDMEPKDPNDPDGDYVYVQYPDFELPTNSEGFLTETGIYPRYVIPTYEQMQALESENDTLKNDGDPSNDNQITWIPKAYQKADGSNVRQKIEYYISTEVHVNSTSSPEHEDFNAFLSGLKWEFFLEDGASLESLEVSEEGKETLIPTTDDKWYRVKEVTITDPSYTGGRFEGAKLWNVYFADDPDDPSKDRYFMRSPVGVTLDMMETEITYDEFYVVYDKGKAERVEKEHTVNAPAPQLHVTNEAADPDSYVWRTEHAGQVLFRPIYDPEGGAFMDQWITTRLYKDPSTPKYVDIQTDDIPQVKDASNQDVKGFWVGRSGLNDDGSETPNDAVSAGKAEVSSYLYDQYRIPLKDKFNTLEFSPAGGGETPFEVAQVKADGNPTNSYTIIYKANHDVNSVKEGKYFLKASYGKIEPVQLELLVRKPESRLSYFETTLVGMNYTLPEDSEYVEATEENPIPGRIIKVNCQVPTLDINGATSTSTAHINIRELANQWRVPDHPGQKLADYDILSDIRNASGTYIDLAAAREKGISIDFKLEYPDGSLPNGVTVGNLQEKGEFSFKSYTKKNTRFNCRITASYQGQSRFVEYQFTFVTDPQKLNRVVINPPSRNETYYKITVPLPGAANSEKAELSVVALDQYGAQWPWEGDMEKGIEGVEDAYNPVDGRLNPSHTVWDEWRVWPKEGTYLPTGITLGGDHYATVTVSPGVESFTFEVYAKFAASTSKPMTVVVAREPSIPKTVDDLKYNNGTNQITSPDMYYPKDSETYEPSILVQDQYNTDITEYDDQKWTMTVTPADASSYVHINEHTGVITVDRYAPNCTLSVTGQITKGGRKKSTTSEVAVKRDNDRPVTLEIRARDEVDYPAKSDVSSTLYQLTAGGSTQYGADQVFAKDKLMWTLNSVEFRDGTTEVYDGSNSSGTIKFANDKYTARNSVELSNRGALNFLGISAEREIPSKITLTVKYTGTNLSAQKVITFNKKPSHAAKLEIPVRDAYKDGVQVPTVGNEVVIPMEIMVRDQYGVIMDESAAPVTWEYTEEAPLGFRVDTAARTVTITPDAQEGSSVNLKAKCGDLSANLTISARQDQPLEIDKVEVKGLEGPDKTLQTGDNFTVPLPAKVGDGYESYTAYCEVRNQFGGLMTGRSVIWTATGPVGVKAQVTDTNGGIIRLYFTTEIRDSILNSTGDLCVTLKAAAQDDSTKYDTAEIHFTLDDPTPAYAVPEVTDYGEGAVMEGGVMKPLVPKKGATANTEVSLKATVYDQYGMPMAGEEASITHKLTSGLSMKQWPNTNTATLYVTSSVPSNNLIVPITATPKDMPDAVVAGEGGSSIDISLSKGTAYLYELRMVDKKTAYDFDIPYWDSKQEGYVPGVDSIDTLPLEACLVDQYDVEMSFISDLYYPVWDFVDEDHEGVEFAGTGDTAEGEGVTLNVSNRAIPEGQLEKTVTLRLRTKKNLPDDKDFMPDDQYFTKYIPIKLTRNAPRATYLFNEGSNSYGVDEDGLYRAYAKDGSAVYQFQPVVYDQYGVPMDSETQAVDKDLDIAALEALNGIEVEKVYARGQSEENGDQPTAYKVYQVEYPEPDPDADPNAKPPEPVKTLLAEFDRPTGNLKTYTVCTPELIEQFTFVANYAPLGDVGVKKLTAIFNEEDLKPYRAEISHSNANYTITGQTDPPINDYIRTTVYDQYGAPYTGDVTVRWILHRNEKNENGEYLPYDTELDEDGNQRFENEFLVRKQDSSDGATTVTVQPDRYYEDKTIILECRVQDNRWPADIDTWLIQYVPIDVRLRKPSSGGPIIATFEAGDYGKLVGPAEFTLGAGEALQEVPGVKTIAGYGFMGWTVDGKTVVDATQIALFGNTTFVAVYKDVTNTKFLTGYTGGYIRPENGVTRAEFITMMVRGFGGFDPNKDYTALFPGESFFPDVQKGDWHANYIAFAKLNGVAKGYPDGTFHPNDVITRAEAAELLTRTAKLTSKENYVFSDVKPGQWYTESVNALYEAGIADGYDDGTYRPNRKITRAEAVKLTIQLTVNALNDLERENIQKYAYCPFLDVKRAHWAYAYILRAAGIA